MSNITLVTGGAASGKTRWALSFFKTCDNVLIINTSEKLTDETENRINYICETNSVDWVIENNVKSPCDSIKDHKFYIFDSLASYTSEVISANCTDINEITKEQKDIVRKTVVENVIEMIHRVEQLNGALVIITIEPGFSVCPKDKEQVLFREILGSVNQRIANTAHEVYMSVSGIQFKIK